MWLPKYERRLLQKYFVKINEVDKQCDFSFDDLLGFIKSKESSRHTPSADDTQDTEAERFSAWRRDCNRIVIANKTLKKRGLIISSDVEFDTSKLITISLTITGYDLGRKYSSWWTLSKLWYEEYIKNHPIWLIVSFLGGIISGVIGTLVVNWLKISG